MNLIELAYPYQRQFILAPQKRKLWLSSRQIGKSWTLAFIAAYKALERKNGLSLMISTGGRAATELIRKVHLFGEAVKQLTNGAITYTPSADSCRFSNGSRIVSLPSGNPTALRGWSAQAVLIDECAFIERPYDVLGAISPTLTRDKDAELIVASTPAGKQGLFWDLYSKSDEAWYVQKTTIEDAVNDGLDVDIEQLKELCPDPEIFDQEYYCKFAEEWSQLVDIRLLEFYDELPKGKRVSYLGVDVGSTSDRTAFVTAYIIDGIIYIDDIIVLHKASYETQLQIAKELHEREGYKAGFVDATGIGSALGEFMSKKVTVKIQPYVWTVANKTPAYENLRAQIFDHKVKFSRKFKQLIQDDFQNVSRIVSETGKVTYEAGHNRNGHSDVTSAIVLAMEGIRQHPASFAMPQTYMRHSSFGSFGSRLS